MAKNDKKNDFQTQKNLLESDGKISFGKVDKNHSTIGRKTFVQCPRTKNSRCFKKKTFPRIFLLDFVAEWSIDDPGEKLLRGNRYILAHSPKPKKKVFHQKTSFPQCSVGQVKCSFDNAYGKIQAEGPKSLFHCSKRIQTFFSSSFLFPIWPHGKQNAVSTTTLKTSASRPK